MGYRRTAVQSGVMEENDYENVQPMSRMNKTMRKGKEAMQEWESRGATKTVKQIAVRIAGKKKPVENEEYLALYTCCPPPFFIIQNWGEMEHPIIRIIVFFILIATNIGISFYKRSMSGNTVGFRPMVAGAVTGLLLGIIVLKNLKESKW